MTLDQKIAVVGIIVAALVALVIFAWQWWDGVSVRVNQRAREVEPDISLQIGSYNHGYNVNVENRGAKATDAVLHLPSVDGVAKRWPEIREDHRESFGVPVANDAPIRTTPMPDATAILECNDALGLVHRHELAITQTHRDDGRYNIGSDARQIHVVRPALGVRDKWRLRNRA